MLLQILSIVCRFPVKCPARLQDLSVSSLPFIPKCSVLALYSSFSFKLECRTCFLKGKSLHCCFCLLGRTPLFSGSFKERTSPVTHSFAGSHSPRHIDPFEESPSSQSWEMALRQDKGKGDFESHVTAGALGQFVRVGDGLPVQRWPLRL